MNGGYEGGLTLKVGERYRKELVLATVFLFALSGFFGVIGTADDVEPQGGLYGGELRVALQSDIEEDPLFADDDASLLAVSLMYDSLAKIDEVTLLPEPWVAINWTLTSNDTVDVNLRTDVEWHDSTDDSPHYVTPTDICNSYTTMKGSANQDWANLLQNVVCTAGTGKVTFDLTTADQARGVFFSKVLTIPIVGPSNLGSGPYQFGTRGSHLLTVTNDMVEDNATDGQRFIIAGAHYHYIDSNPDLFKNDVAMSGSDYSVDPTNGTITLDVGAALSSGDIVTANYGGTRPYTTLVAFERHFVKRPYLDAINYTFYPDTDSAVKAMIDNLVDFIGFDIPSGAQNALRWEGGADETTLGLTPTVSVQTTNPKLTLLYLGMNTPVNPLNDTQFRKGLSMSIKRELAMSFEASTTIADTMIHPSNSYWHNPNCPKFRVPKDEDNQPILTDIINHFQDNGYLDPDEDGYLEDPTGADFRLEVLVPPTGEDPSKASIGGQAIGDVFNDVGVQTDTVYLPSDDIADRVEMDNFSLYLSTVDVEIDPIFLYDLFHKDGDSNDVNLDDPFLNDMLDNVRLQVDQAVRQTYVQDAVCYIAETAPVGTILHYKVLESYEKMNYEGWVQMTGGVNNFWSFLEVHYQQLGAMKAQIILLVDSVQAGELIDVVVSATNLVDSPLEGAWVKVTNDHNSDVVINYTDAAGEITFNWTGPDVTLSTTVTFTATVRIPQYDESIAENAITVHPLIQKMLVSIAAQEKVMQSGEETVITVEVVDDLTGIGLPDVTLVLTLSGGAGGELGAYSGVTDPTGRFSTTFTGDVTASVQYAIEVTTSKDGYEPSASSQLIASVIINPESQEDQDITMLLLIIVLLVILIVLVLALVARRMRAGGGVEEEFEEEELEEEIPSAEDSLDPHIEEEFEEEAEVLIEE
jgi:ABC-type transport system substrate-binding protein